MENLECQHCHEATVEFIKENPPYSLEHFVCPECSSTFGYPMYAKGWEKDFFKALYEFVVRRSQQMNGDAPKTETLFEDYGEIYITELLGREESPIVIKNDYITLKKW